MIYPVLPEIVSEVREGSRPEHCGQTRLRILCNPKGIVSSSPGLPQRGYPGSSVNETNISNRNAVAAHRYPSPIGHNAVGVVSRFERAPKVGAGAPTLGWR